MNGRPQTLTMHPPVARQSARLEQAVALHRNGRLAQAQSLYQEILKVEPRHVDALHLLGVIAAQTKNPQKAVDLIGKAIALRPDWPAAYFDRALALSQLEQNRAALANYDQAIAGKPDFAEAYCNRGNVLMELEQFEAALDSYNKAIAVRPGFAMAYSNRGSVLKKLRRLEAALASYNQAIAINGDYAEAYFNRGVVLNELKSWDAALASYDRAIAIRADYAEAYCHKSYVQLVMGDFKNGWLNSEWRWKSKYGSNIHEKRYFPQPLWLGDQPLSGRTILLHSEQGLGDTIQFCRYAELVADLGAKVILEVQKPLVSLLANLEGVSRLISKGTEAVDFDYQCPLLSLPLAFKTELHTIPASVRYLRSDASKVARWQVKLGAKNAPRIGLAWRGNPKNGNDHNRSISLADLIRHLPCDFQYVSLQKEVLEGDEKALHAAAGILSFAGDQNDFSDAAALCECMDAVISVDTSLAHLGAALGKPTRILLPFAADWRWLAERADSPWYPTARLYRQKNRGDWKGALDQLKSDLIKEFKAIQAQ